MSQFLESLFSLRGKAALVTGASGGIGRALAVGLAEAGAAVAAGGRDTEALAETVRQIEAKGGVGVALPADLAEVETCRRLVQDAHAALGRLDILVNCAGTNRRAPLSAATAEEFDLVTAANLRAPYFLSQAAHALMKAQGGGKIVNVGSITSSWGLGGVSVYGATKAALAQLTKTQAVEWAAANVQVNCLAPGFLRTPLTEKAIWGDPRRRRWLLDRIPAGRAGRPEDMVGAMLFLASPASDYLTGQIVTVDGGFLAGGWWDAE